MFLVVRAITYSTLFVAFLLVFLPARVLSGSGIAAPVAIGTPQILGMAASALGAAVALWCIGTFAVIGRGTPAPFDAPRRLVIAGPYRYVRNPMYLGAILALAGAALYYGSWALVAYCAAFALAMHGFIVIHEEPALRRAFGDAYAGYCGRVKRWRPSW